QASLSSVTKISTTSDANRNSSPLCMKTCDGSGLTGMKDRIFHPSLAKAASPVTPRQAARTRRTRKVSAAAFISKHGADYAMADSSIPAPAHAKTWNAPCQLRMNHRTDHCMEPGLKCRLTEDPL